MENNKQPSYYAIMPSFIRYDNRLNNSEKIIYTEITALTNKNGYCFATNRYFSELYGVSKRSISRWIAKLEKYNYIRTEIVNREVMELPQRRIYIVNDSPIDKNVYTHIDKDVHTHGQSCLTPMDKSVHHNNINNNITDNKMIDDLLVLILKNSSEIPKEF
ncbi:MAG: helix-turn-helix domain-containing protein [Oscillospiraceae bacterium]|nr:helix-turn-helix domain-containing protein [Oscillospiraceae bacterium]